MSTTLSTFIDSTGVEWNVEQYISRVCIERWNNGVREIRLSLDSPDQIDELIAGLGLVPR